MQATYRLTTLDQFRDYMFRKLGEEFWNVELTDAQFQDILRDAINYYVQYSNSGSYTSKVLIDVNNRRDFILPEEILGIKKILGISKSPLAAELRTITAISGDVNDVNDFIKGFENGSVSLVPTYEDPTADGDLSADDGTSPAEQLFDLDGNQLVELPKMEKPSNNSLYNFFGQDYGFSSGFLFPIMTFMKSNSDITLSSYAMTMQYFNTIRNLFKTEIYYQFKTESKRLILGESVEMILIEAEIREAPEYFFNDHFFKMIVEEKMLTQWADNLSLKYMSEGLMGNGINLNIDRILQKAESIKAKIENGFEQDEWDGLLPPMRVGKGD